MHSLEKDYGSVVHGENLYRPSFFKAWIEDWVWLVLYFLVYIRGLLLLKGNTGPLRFDKLR